MKRFFYILCQCTWGFPQTLLGALIFLCNLRRRRYCFRGAVASHWGMRFSASIGLFLFIAERDADCRRLVVHEYGHALQSLVLGPFYLFIIGLPSMLWLRLPCFRKMRRRKRISYYAFYTERWANCWGERICGEPSMGLAHID